MKTILFVCEGNSIRSIIAEALFNQLCKKDYTAKSAGTLHALRIDSKTKKVLGEANILLKKEKPSALEFETADNAEKIILMNKDIPNFPRLIPSGKLIKWDIADPLGEDIEKFRKTRDEILIKVKELIELL